jgi:3-oxoacyl-[acyl-carrier protein] reductase
MNLDGKIAVVTGASRNLGRAIALELARAGADVVVNYAAQADAAEEVAAEIRALGRRALVVGGKVEEFDAMRELMDRTLAEFGRIDVLVNNAGILKRSFLMMMKSEDFAEVLAVNTLGTFNAIKAASRTMVKQRSGSIVNVSSLAGLRGLAGQGAYAASKGAVQSLTTVAAKELGHYGVRVNCVAPAVINTGMMLEFDDKTRSSYLQQIPLGRAGEPEEVGRVVAFLASDAASYLTGLVMPIDGGMYIG